MSLARAFTTRRGDKDQPLNLHIGRAASTRNGRPVKRSQISSPVALISSTNALSYDAPDLPGTKRIHTRNITGSSATSSSDESEAPSLSFDGNDASSIDETPDTPTSGPEPNHLSCYFKPAVETSANSSPLQSPHLSAASTFDAPIVPQRAPSHSKKAHEHLSRQRSMRLTSPPLSTRSSAEVLSPSRSNFVEAPRENPFGKELAQLDEVAEEFGNTVRDVEADADTTYMQSHNLAAFDASAYLTEIHDLLNELYGEETAEVGSWF